MPSPNRAQEDRVGRLAVVTVGASFALLLVLDVAAAAAARTTQTQGDSKTFASARWGVAFEYPADWSFEDDGDEVRFRSVGEDAIVLSHATTDTPSEPAPGRRTAAPSCTTTMTVHAVVATVCGDPSSSMRRAVLVLNARDGRRWRLALTNRARDANAFDAIVASARPYPE